MGNIPVNQYQLILGLILLLIMGLGYFLRRKIKNGKIFIIWDFIKVRPLLLTVCTGLLIFGLSAIAHLYAVHNAKDNLAAFSDNIKDPEGKEKIIFQSSDKAENMLLQRIQDQYEDVKKHEHYHLNIIVFFNAHYYSVIALLLVTSAFAAILLFSVTKDGWANSSIWHRTIFLTVASASIIYSTLPSVFKFESNINASESLFKSYYDTENHIRSTMAKTINGADSSNRIIFTRLIDHVDSQLVSNCKINVGFDFTKASDFGKTFKEATK